MVLRVAEQFPRVATVRHRAHKRFHVVDDLRGHVAANIVFNPFAQWFTLELRDAVALRPGCPAVPLFSECRAQCAQTVLDTADIVRDGDISTVTR